MTQSVEVLLTDLKELYLYAPQQMRDDLYKQAIDTAFKAVREQALAEAMQWVRNRRDAFCNENAIVDPDTGTLEFGRGAHAVAKEEYLCELEEIIDGIRGLRALTLKASITECPGFHSEAGAQDCDHRTGRRCALFLCDQVE